MTIQKSKYGIQISMAKGINATLMVSEAS